jgi:hypothetical protein
VGAPGEGFDLDFFLCSGDSLFKTEIKSNEQIITRPGCCSLAGLTAKAAK